MYKDLDIEFLVRDFQPYGDYFGKGIEPIVSCFVRNRRYPVHDRMHECYIPANMEKRAAQIYRSINYSLFASIQISFSNSHDGDEGSILLSFEAVKFVTRILKGSELHTLKINIDDFSANSLIYSFIPELPALLTGGSLRLLMLPLGRLYRTNKLRMEMEAPAEIHRLLWQQDITKFKRVKKVESNRCIVKLPSPPKSRSSEFDWHNPYNSPWGDSRTIRQVTSFLDMQLDITPGKYAQRLVHHRWDTWTRGYERRLIEDIRLWDGQTQNKYFTILSERWAVWRTMEKRLLAKDRAGWHDREDEPTAHTHWVFDVEGIPRYGNRPWDRLKYEGLFYDRRILVIPDGLQWHPEDVERSSDQEVKLPETIYFEHMPPKRPQRRPR